MSILKINLLNINSYTFKSSQGVTTPKIDNENKPSANKQKVLIGLSTIAALAALGIISKKIYLSKKIKTQSIEPPINLSQETQPPNLEKTKDKIIEELENRPLKIPKFREEGDSRLLFQALTSEEKNDLSNFLSKKQFSKSDYDNLSKLEKNKLRELANKNFQYKDDLFKIEHPIRSIAKDLDFLTKVTDKVEESLKSKYPKGFTIVALGGSPSLINDILATKGYECKNIPFSRSFFEKEEANLFDFEKYLNKFGITKNNSQDTNFVYTDYILSSQTKQSFESLMKKNGFEYNFESMSELYKNLPPEDSDFMRNYFLQGSNIKAYVTCPKLTEYSQHTHIEDVMKDYEWGNPAKLMHFAIFDKLDNINL